MCLISVHTAITPALIDFKGVRGGFWIVDVCIVSPHNTNFTKSLSLARFLIILPILFFLAKEVYVKLPLDLLNYIC